MHWTALVPLRIGVDGKSRLSAVIGGPQRQKLAARMANHVIETLSLCQPISRLVVLSQERFDCSLADWAPDKARGLNPEIAAFRQALGTAPILVVHADLPLLSADEICALLSAAENHGIALATDRAGEGTNALAIADGRPFEFRFGAGSCALHCAQDAAMPVLQLQGLSADLDTPADLEFLKALGWQL